MSRSCTSRGGKPKKAFATEAEAQAFAARHGGWYHAYACKAHGWHIGGVVSHALRVAIGKA